MIQCTIKECNYTQLVKSSICLMKPGHNGCVTELTNCSLIILRNVPTSSQHHKIWLSDINSLASCESIQHCNNMWQHYTHYTCGPMRVIKSEKERIADSALWASRGSVRCFFPLFTKYSTVIESQGQRNRQLRMRYCMRSFRTCHSKETSLES